MENRKRELYKKYSGVCLSHEEYMILERTRTIPSNLGSVYNGTLDLTKKSINFLQGNVISHICASGVKMFLEDWANNAYTGREPRTGLFVFQDYMVILEEPKVYEIASPRPTPIPDVLPVVIPVNRIKKVIREQKRDEICN